MRFKPACRNQAMLQKSFDPANPSWSAVVRLVRAWREMGSASWAGAHGSIYVSCLLSALASLYR